MHILFQLDPRGMHPDRARIWIWSDDFVCRVWEEEEMTQHFSVHSVVPFCLWFKDKN